MKQSAEEYKLRARLLRRRIDIAAFFEILETQQKLIDRLVTVQERRMGIFQEVSV